MLLGVQHYKMESHAITMQPDDVWLVSEMCHFSTNSIWTSLSKLLVHSTKPAAWDWFRRWKVYLIPVWVQCCIFCKMKCVHWSLSIIFQTAIMEVRRILVNPHTVAFVGAEVCVTLVYIFRCQIPWVFIYKDTTLDQELLLPLAGPDGWPLEMNDSHVCKHVQLGPGLRWPPEV